MTNRCPTTPGADHPWALHAVFGLLLVTVLANGLHFWLQKSQLIPSPTYQEYLLGVDDFNAGKTPDPPQLDLEGFYVVPDQWILSKLLKDVFVFVFFVTSLLFLGRSVPAWCPVLAVPAAFCLSIAMALGYSFHHYGPWVALAGLRPIAYVAAGLLGVWATRRGSMEVLSRYLVAILLAELVIALYEHIYGISIFSTQRTYHRVSGTFSFPSSLGIFAITAIAVALVFSAINRVFLGALALAFVYLTGSATALILLVAGCMVWAISMVPASSRKVVRLAFLGIVVVVLLAMPKLLARYDVFDSLWGRVEVATDYWNNRPPVKEILLGKGLGIGSNAFNSALSHSRIEAEPAGVDLYHARTDSTLLALINQVGLVGALLFYLTLVSAALRDRTALPIYAILILAGMTVNILELYPVNFILGLLLGRSLFTPGKHDS